MTDKPTAAGGTPEPSMEDILASIRRILSEEGGEQGQGGAPGDQTAVPEDADDPPPFRAAAPPEAATIPPANVAPLQFTEEQADVEIVDAVPQEEYRPSADVFELTPAMRVAPVLSATTTSAATDVLSQLAKAILDRRDIAIGGRDVTLEGMVREMLRPLLREWLDRNLPYLIERLVKKEIDLMINRAERLDR